MRALQSPLKLCMKALNTIVCTCVKPCSDKRLVGLPIVDFSIQFLNTPLFTTNLQIRRYKVKSYVTNNNQIQSLTRRHTSCATTHLEFLFAVGHSADRAQQLSIGNDVSDTEIYSLSTSDDENEFTATVAHSDIPSPFFSIKSSVATLPLL